MAATLPTLTTRHASLKDLEALLRQQHTLKHDVVVPASGIRAIGTRLEVPIPPVISEHGVTSRGLFDLTQTCEQGVADKLKIPKPYLNRMRLERPGLFADNINGWLDGDGRTFLVRTLLGADGTGVARAFLSDSYRFMDNLDALIACLDGIRQAGVPVEIAGCDLSEDNMYVRVVCEEVRAYAPGLLKGYRSPFTGHEGTANPVVFAGLVVTNSETGCGAFSIVPRLVVQVCRNGMTITEDAARNVHLGGRLDEGRVEWSADTHHKHLDLIVAKTRDAVASFLSPHYVQAKVNELEELAGAPVREPDKTLKVISKELAFTEAQQRDILAHFIQGAQLTAGGLMHAVTSAAQTQTSADAAHLMETRALRTLQLVAEGR